MNQRFFDYANLQKLESQGYDKIKEVPQQLVITHIPIGPNNKVFQILPPFFQ
jgi:hypothetical protein